MKTFLKSTLTISLIAFSSSAFAKYTSITEACDHYNTSYDKTYCFAKLFMESDKELNTVYKSLKNTVKGSTKKELTQVQRNWIKYRDQSCEYTGSIDVNCNYRVNKERTEFLQDRLRECKTGNCRSELITRESW